MPLPQWPARPDLERADLEAPAKARAVHVGADIASRRSRTAAARRRSTNSLTKPVVPNERTNVASNSARGQRSRLRSGVFGIGYGVVAADAELEPAQDRRRVDEAGAEAVTEDAEADAARRALAEARDRAREAKAVAVAVEVGDLGGAAREQRQRAARRQAAPERGHAHEAFAPVGSTRLNLRR